MASFIELLYPKAYISSPGEYIREGALELGLKLNASYKDFPLPQIRGGREIRSAESPDDFPLSSN